MSKKDELIVVDFDGTLFFTEKCTRLAAKEILKKNLSRKQIRNLPRPIKDKVYDLAFTKYNHHSILNKRLRTILSKKIGSKIIILTARSKISNSHMKILLKKYNIKVSGVFCRNKIEMKLDDEEWKRRFLGKIVHKYKSVILYEDKMDNIEHIHSNLEHNDIKCYLVSPKGIKRVK